MTEEVIKKSLRHSIYDGIAFAVMDGLTASFLTPFAIALNASVSLIAALSYVPQVAGAFVQLFASKLVEILKDRRMIIVVCSLIHAFLWLPLVLLPYLTPNKKYLLIVYVTLQALIAEIIAPVWTSLIGDIVPKYDRGRFFGFRNRIIGITTFISTLFAGLILNYLSPKNPFLGFSILFGIAFIARILSAVFKAGMHNPMPDFAYVEKFTIFDFVGRMNKTNYGHFVIYIAFFKFAVSIASPFFVLYIIKELGFSYLKFTIIIAAEIIASFVAMSIWGNLIDKRGTKFVLYLTGMLTPLIPFFWLFSHNYFYLILIQAFSGISWAGFNLSSSNFIFDTVKPVNRIRCVAYYKFFESIAIVAGASLGGILINILPAWIFVSSILFVFLISGILRLIISLILLPTLKEARLIEVGIGSTFFKNYIVIRPSQGLVYEVIGKYNRDEERKTCKQKMQKISKQQSEDKKDSLSHNQKLLKFIGKRIFRKREGNSITDMDDIEHIAHDINKGNIRK